MDNKNSTKQVLLSVIGIAILVVAVVGVSFAFFTYSKTGEKNNVLTAGSIFFDFSEGSEIKLINQFPISDEAGKALSDDNGKNGVLTFDVKGYDGSKKGIDYTVYAIKGEIPTKDKITELGETTYEETDRLKDQDIKFYLTAESKNGTSGVTSSSPNGIDNKFSSPQKVNNNNKQLTDETTDDNAVVLATGKITAETKENEQTDTYKFRMWISDDVVVINNDMSNEDKKTLEIDKDNATNKSVYTQEDFAKKFYSVKIKVVAKTSVTQ